LNLFEQADEKINKMLKGVGTKLEKSKQTR
jgi:hypothetical protein